MNESPTFSTWLNDHVKEENLLGSLARSVAADPHWPVSGDLATYQAYLDREGAPPEVESVLQMAWDKYTALHH